jgi:hypothetical protein
MITQEYEFYAIVTGSLFFCLILFNYRNPLNSAAKTSCYLVKQYAVYPQFFLGHRYWGPWSRAGLGFSFLYMLINMLCLGFRRPAIQEAGLRAANLSLINIIPVFAGPHLSFLADILGISLASIYRVHRYSGIMSCFLIVFHTIVVASDQSSWSFHQIEHIWGLVVSMKESLV